MYSLGLTLANDGESTGTIRDIRVDSNAFAAGLAPGMHVVAVDGRKFSADVFHQALHAHTGSFTPLRLIVTNDDFYRVVEIDARQGERFPHLVRVPSAADVLAKIYAPRTFVPTPEPSHPADRR